MTVKAPVRRRRSRALALGALFPVMSGIAAGYPIIDTHIHIYDPSRPEGVPWPSRGSSIYRTVLPSHHRALGQPLGVTGAVIVECSNRLEDNQWVLDQIRDEPDYLGLIGNLVFGNDAFAASLDRFATDGKFVGLRMRTQTIRRSNLESAAGAPVLRDLKLLADKGLVLEASLSTGQGNTLDDYLAVAELVPNLPIIIDHLANARVNGQAVDTAWLRQVRALAAHAHVACKISGLVNQSVQQPASNAAAYYQPVLEALWLAFGEDRLMYGSNWPVSEEGGDFAAQQKLVVDFFQAKGQAVLEKVMAGNAMRILGLSTTRIKAPRAIGPSGESRRAGSLGGGFSVHGIRHGLGYAFRYGMPAPGLTLLGRRVD